MSLTCLRCNGTLEDITPEKVEKIKFFSCQSCPCQYKQNEEGRLCDRWLMPLTLPLYLIIFEKDPISRVEGAIAEISKKNESFVNILIEHITAEINQPTQKLTDIHQFTYPDEEKLREYLQKIRDGLLKIRAGN